ncbi:DMT family transporter [Phenylobacterium sp.]|jgi:drug/metabolite transporter (DMT)-like permease|uniref:DMT family transporter n=1 Tax=Phenylobacterium sp. TaxID=1871053 RepID=UPI003783AAC3
MLWVLLAGVAAPLQVARNATQRGLVADAGPWGATLVRFLFGLPFTLLILAVVYALTPDAAPHLSARFWIAIASGAIAQIVGTAALLVAMRRSGFAVATLLQQSALPLAAVFGWAVAGDHLSATAWGGVAVASAGLVVLSWPKPGELSHGLSGGLLGLAAGFTFAISFNGYRQAGVALDPAHPIYSATASLVIAQTLQSAAMCAVLLAVQPAALRAVATSWRRSLTAGVFGSAASACWFAALALAPAAQVRAVGLVEGPVAAAVGRRLFRESLSLRQWLGGALTATGVCLCILG